MNFQPFTLLFLIVFCISCQKESKNFPRDLDQLRKIEKEILKQKTINCNSTIEKKLCENNWYFDFNWIGENSFIAKKK